MNSTLKTRGITAIIFITVMIFGLFFNSYTFIGLICLIVGGSIWEFISITCEKNNLRMLLCIGGGVGINLLLALGNMTIIPKHFLIFTFFTLIFVSMLICINELYTQSAKPYQNISFAVFSLAYYALFIGSLFFISFDDGVYNAWKVFALLALTWTNDTMAYMVGSQIGKTKLFERMSPNKTWEGTIGGILFTIVVAFIFYHFIGIFSPQAWFAIALIIGILGSLGDLVESMLKRSLAVKDTGTLLPGHGGLLDRFDSFTFHLPISVCFIQLTSAF